MHKTVFNLHVSGNVLCLFVFTQKKVELKPSFANILKCLSVFDILFLVSSVCLQRRAEGWRKGRPSPPKVILGGDCLPPKFPDNLLKKCILEIHTFSFNIYGLNYYKKR